MTTAILHLGRTAAGPLLTLELAEALIAHGESIVVVYSSDAEIADDLAALDCPTLAIPTFHNSVTALTRLPRLPALARRIDQFLSEHDAETVVITMEQIWQAIIAPVFRRRREVLLFVHDATPHPGEDGVLERTLRSRQRRHSDGAIVLSQHVGDALAATRTYPPERIWRTVHPAFHTPPAKRRTLPADKIVIGFFGRMSKYKGLHLGAAAVAELRRRGRDVEFRVIGEGIPLDVPRIADDGNVLEDRWVSQDDVAEVIAGFDVLLLPYTEASQSGVLAYAMALGIPSVVTPVGGLIEQARETGAAVIAASVDALALADSVDALLRDPSSYAELSGRALDAAATDFSWVRTARDVAGAAKAVTSFERQST